MRGLLWGGRGWLLSQLTGTILVKGWVIILLCLLPALEDWRKDHSAGMSSPGSTVLSISSVAFCPKLSPFSSSTEGQLLYITRRNRHFWPQHSTLGLMTMPLLSSGITHGWRRHGATFSPESISGLCDLLFWLCWAYYIPGTCGLECCAFETFWTILYAMAFRPRKNFETEGLWLTSSQALCLLVNSLGVCCWTLTFWGWDCPLKQKTLIQKFLYFPIHQMAGRPSSDNRHRIMSWSSKWLDSQGKRTLNKEYISSRHFSFPPKALMEKDLGVSLCWWEATSGPASAPPQAGWTAQAVHLAREGGQAPSHIHVYMDFAISFSGNTLSSQQLSFIPKKDY